MTCRSNAAPRSVGGSIFVENGAKALGQAEMWLGAGRGARHAIVTLWGTGVGAAIFTDGTLYRGATSSAGEWGHTCIVAGRAQVSLREQPAAWRHTLAPTHCSTSGVASTPSRRPYLDADDETWAARLVEAAADGGPAAETLDVAANYFGIAAANLANLFNPEVIVISGWLGLALGPTILERIRDSGERAGARLHGELRAHRARAIPRRRGSAWCVEPRR